MLSQGLGANHEVHNIVLTASDLYHEMDKVSGPGPGGGAGGNEAGGAGKAKKLRINAVGSLTLELMVGWCRL